MGIVHKLITSVSGLYNNINPITLSGVNDVIVVEGRDGILRCTEFQLRFGRLYFYGVNNQTVHLFINGKMCDIVMSITSQGELFFEKDTEDDLGMDYDIILEYNKKLSTMFDSDDEMILSKRLEQLSLGNASDLSTLNFDFLAKFKEKNFNIEDIEFKKYLRSERAENLKKRMYGQFLHQREYKDSYHDFEKKFVKFGNLINSTEHFDFLIGRYRSVLHLIVGLHLYPPFNDKTCDGNTKGCVGASISFSLCYNKKIQESLDHTFNSFLVQEIRNIENLVVRVQGCKKCSFRFYLPYDIFCKIFFEIQGSRINKAKRIMKILENEHNKHLGWNIFGTKKIIKRDVSFSLKLDSEELKMLNLKEGKNQAVFKISGLNKHLEGNIYLWKDDAKIIVSDIDGTITKSDVWGHLYGMIGKDWTHHGVASLYTKIVRNGYKIVYLTARSLGQSFSTKSYLKNVCQDGYKLPDGPVILSPDGVFAALYRELIIRRPEDFKIACLKTIQGLFCDSNPFVAGFGNKITDVITYKAMEIPLSRIFTINHKGELYVELVKTLSGTYRTMNDFVDSMFPYLSAKTIPFIDHSFSDFSWWSIQNKSHP
ncbi:plasmid maintenance protein [Encephalitozoon intestinalis ATCC 50506]|uniref:Plasmid maintenance protein n=1 Tax=Encephalitozoon intestinalis (strain ATCC 50506) TaxID=876142 RepID=E0S5M8_ENCIT|nr:plasmid maintenance protein [Encephalitozoon intestinalis ATCC 50506]ADM11013.1 plasmid maintenance protein [Encephalitozoon intestinalis ATCC 50506]UTX44659.1 plasmid maintenance protein [Encephalitozoon intestinalis]